MLHQMLLGIKDEMDGACSMHGQDEKFIQNFSQKT